MIWADYQMMRTESIICSESQSVFWQLTLILVSPYMYYTWISYMKKSKANLPLVTYCQKAKVNGS